MTLKHMGRKKPEKEKRQVVKCPSCKKRTTIDYTTSERIGTKIIINCEHCENQFVLK